MPKKYSILNNEFGKKLVIDGEIVTVDYYDDIKFEDNCIYGYAGSKDLLVNKKGDLVAPYVTRIEKENLAIQETVKDINKYYDSIE